MFHRFVINVSEMHISAMKGTGYIFFYLALNKQLIFWLLNALRRRIFFGEKTCTSKSISNVEPGKSACNISHLLVKVGR